MSGTNQQPHEVANSAEDGFLYHYTSLEALVGIITKKVLWATHIRYLNDTSEQIMLRELASKRILEHASLQPEIAPGQVNSLNSLPSGELVPFFIICFSEDGGDRLSQWRGYGGSAGVCLKFNKSLLSAYLDEQDGGRPVRDGELSKIRYVSPKGDAASNDLIDGIITPFAEELTSFKVFIDLSFKGVFFKHEAFREEKEWRIRILDHNELKYQVRGSLLVPYVEFDLAPKLGELLESVIVGPINHKEQTAEAVKTLLASTGLQSVEVICSEIPYRGF